MTSPNLERLAHSGELKAAQVTHKELDGFLRRAHTLEHSAGLAPAECRLFSLCHERRNKAEYEGRFEVGEALVEALRSAASDLLERVTGMTPP